MAGEAVSISLFKHRTWAIRVLKVLYLLRTVPPTEHVFYIIWSGESHEQITISNCSGSIIFGWLCIGSYGK